VNPVGTVGPVAPTVLGGRFGRVGKLGRVAMLGPEGPVGPDNTGDLIVVNIGADWAGEANDRLETPSRGRLRCDPSAGNRGCSTSGRDRCKIKRTNYDVK